MVREEEAKAQARSTQVEGRPGTIHSGGEGSEDGGLVRGGHRRHQLDGAPPTLPCEAEAWVQSNNSGVFQF